MVLSTPKEYSIESVNQMKKEYDLYMLLLGLACNKGRFTINEAFEYVKKIDPKVKDCDIFRNINELAIRDLIIPKDNVYELIV